MIKPAKLMIALGLVLVLILMENMLPALGETNQTKRILLRLEDVGPGGQYDSPEQLGKLRAVFDFLAQEQVRYQIGVISKWIDIPENKAMTVKQLDDGAPFTQSFVKVLKQAQDGGAVIGMHGYTHQVGATRRGDGQHESGIGNEFDVPDVPESATAAFAAERLAAGAAIMQRAGIMPRFWEAPHYHYAAGQQSTFRSAFGLIYENRYGNPRQSDASANAERNIAWGAPTLGSVNVPTPLSYIPYNRDERLILDQLGRTNKLASFFYHPFLEFKWLQPVLDASGEPTLRDGLPVYEYPQRTKTNLQKLVLALRDKGYTFYSLLDYVPFTPAASVFVGAKTGETSLQLGDVTGDGQSDIVVWSPASGNVTVTAGQFRGMRNETPAKPAVWLNIPRRKGDLFALADDNGDGKLDLWVRRAEGTIESYRSSGSSFVRYRTWPMSGQPVWSKLYALRGSSGETILAGTARDGTQLYAYTYRAGQPDLQPVPPYQWRMAGDKRLSVGRETPSSGDSLWLPRSDTASCFKLELETGATGAEWKLTKVPLNISGDGGELRFGDFNGDSWLDALLWRGQERSLSVYIRIASGEYRYLSQLGPWGKANAQLLIADLDGNGKSDIAIAGGDGYVDTALSFQSDLWAAGK
ncbi:DUF2334 domain-containing protein [Paenibacillus cymbidii]|uniref:DUF2334 domain-containing protein n=1 Tax=Paenibacillus cymbidii TaxID=1639034 RepID=UPI00143677F0|nr:DUF2334 domain-containing protein [Paenibacillus cymbidii]